MGRDVGRYVGVGTWLGVEVDVGLFVGGIGVGVGVGVRVLIGSVGLGVWVWSGGDFVHVGVFLLSSVGLAVGVAVDF